MALLDVFHGLEKGKGKGDARVSFEFSTRFENDENTAFAPAHWKSFYPSLLDPRQAHSPTQRREVDPGREKTHRRNRLRHSHPTRHDRQPPPTEPRHRHLMLHIRHLALEVEQTHIVKLGEDLSFHFGSVRVGSGEEGKSMS